MYQSKRIAFAAIVAAGLGGCAHKDLKFRPTMGADPSEIGYEAQALINEMRRAYVETGQCSGIAPSLQNTEKESHQRLGKTFGCVQFRNAEEDKDVGITPVRYYEAGLALSDIYCDDYFRRIAEHKQKRQFGRSTTNDLGTAASAGLGLASAGSILTGGIGAAFGLADNLFRNYDSAFVVEPNLGKMLKLIKTAQTTYKDGVQPSSFTTYFEAHRAVTEYAQKCSYVGMDALLDRAIEAGTDAMTIESSVAAFQTAKERQQLRVEEDKALIEEGKLDAVRRQREAKEKTAAEAAAMAGTGTAPPPVEPQNPDDPG